MTENLNAVLARIGEIKAWFGVEYAVLSPVRTQAETRGLKPYFPEVLAGVLGGQSIKQGEVPAGYEGLINSSALKYGVPAEILKALVQVESGFNADAVSPAGAMGLTQLMPGTARALGVTDPFDPVQNIEGGARYLRQQLDQFGNDMQLALAAYNAGPGAVTRYEGIPPFTETRNYVQKVLNQARAYGFELR